MDQNVTFMAAFGSLAIARLRRVFEAQAPRHQGREWRAALADYEHALAHRVRLDDAGIAPPDPRVSRAVREIRRADRAVRLLLDALQAA